MNAATQLRGEVLTSEPMALHTSWRVGGPADRFYQPADTADLQAFLRSLPEDEPLTWVGLGSNLLVRDGGIRGTAICTHGAMDDIERVDEKSVRTGAGVHCARLAKYCATEGLGGAAFFIGIPGTVGGALAMNAGAWRGETWDFVRAVEMIDREGEITRIDREQFETAYRSVTPPHVDRWYVAAEFVFDSPAESDSTLSELLAERRATQPVGKPSCGSVFRNPPDDYAARLIEACGLKGFSIGGARVSEKHANFILNSGDATAADIEALIAHVQQVVLESQDIQLVPEVRIVGEPT